jgi:hypothetical protein
MKVTRITQAMSAVALVVASVAGTSVLLSPQAGAAGPDAGTGSAYGVTVSSSLLGGAVIPETPLETLNPTTGVGGSASDIPLNLGIVDVNALNAATGSFDYGTANEVIASSAGVAGDFDVFGVNLLQALDVQAITTACSSSATGSTASADFLSISGTSTPIPLGDVISGSDLGPLSGLISVSLNDETIDNSHNNTTSAQVIGLEVTVLSTGVVVKAGVSNCGATGPDILPVATPGPIVDSVVPPSGPVAGGQSVVINGANFTGTTAVDFGPANPAIITAISATTIDATTPPGTAGLVNVTVTTNAGTSAITANDEYTYLAAPPVRPVVTSVTPDSDPDTGGNTITIAGANFTGASAVDFGEAPATNVDVVSAGEITATDPAGTGEVNVTVTTLGGTSLTSAADAFTYTVVTPPPSPGGPVVTSVVPNTGPEAGGDTVTINGGNLENALVVDFGTDNPVTTFSEDTPTQIILDDPIGMGTVDVIVTTQGGTSAANPPNDQFTYTTTPAPVVTSVVPDSGPNIGGNTVQINGANFTGATVVDFGADGAASHLVVDSPTQLTVVDPAGTTGQVDVTVTTPGGTSATGAGDKFTYNGTAISPPTIGATGLSPLFGPTAGNTLVTITGTNLSSTTSVLFGTVAGTGIVNVSSGEVPVATPPEAAGAVTVTLTTASGGSTTAPQNFTFVGAPTISATGLNPTNGPTTGGTLVTITGSGFAVGVPTTVTFGGDASTTVDVDSSTELTAVSPAHAVGAVSVVVSDAGGTATAAQQFTYISAPVTVTGIDPTFGPTAGGTTIVVTGNGFSSTSTVTIGGNNAPVTAGSVNAGGTSLTVTSPPGPAGTVDLIVTTPGIGTSPPVVTDDFTYVGTPTITSLTPTSGPTSGGTLVTLTGGVYAGTVSVEFGTTPATDVTVISDSEVTAVSPANAAGAVTVSLTDLGGTVTAAQEFTYVPPVTPPPPVPSPTITGISPTSGPQAGGETVFIEGSNLCNGSGLPTVNFGSNGATVQSVNTACTQATVTEPAGIGTVQVTLTNSGGTATSPIDFTYISPGYWEAAADGGVFAFGGAQFYGSVPGALKPGQKLVSPIVAMADTPDHGGYWLFAADGGVFAFGDAHFYGSVYTAIGTRKLNGPIVAAEATPDGLGYRMFAADGGVFDFGDAQFINSLPGEHIIPSAPIVGAIANPIGVGYWLVAQDGGVFTFGDSTYEGSAVGDIASPVVGMATTPDGLGYFIFEANGGEVSEGDAPAGLAPGGGLNAPIVFGQSTSTGQGFWEFATDGGVFTYGDAPYENSAPGEGVRLNEPITAAIAFGSDPIT